MLRSASRIIRSMFVSTTVSASRDISFMVPQQDDEDDSLLTEGRVLKLKFELTPTPGTGTLTLGSPEESSKFMYRIPPLKEHLRQIQIAGEFYTFTRARFCTGVRSTTFRTTGIFENDQLVHLNHMFENDNTYVYLKCRDGITADYFNSFYEIIIPEWSNPPFETLSQMSDSVGNRLIESEMIFNY